MASEHTMDVVVKFDFQELKNAVEQAKKEATNRFDLKNSDIKIDLSDDEVKITAPSSIQVESVFGILTNKMTSRGLSSLILDRQDMADIGGMRVKMEMKLVKALDQENAKKISKMIKDQFAKVKPSIQGDTVRVSSKSINDLQEVMAMLKNDETINMPLDFVNFK